MNHSTGGPDTPGSFDVPGLGKFVYDGQGGDYRNYVFSIDAGGRKPTLVLAYLHQDESRLTDAYLAHIARVVNAVTPDCRPLLHSVREQLLQLMERYEIDAPENYADLVDEMRLTHIKPFPEGGGELIFDLCSWIVNFNVNIALDADLQVKDVWFDG